MDVAALILAILAVIAGLASSLAARPGRLGTVGVAVALLAASLICQFVALTGSAVTVPHH